MKWKAYAESFNSRHYEIKYDPSVGFYLYVFEGDRCIYDYLQDTLEIAMECAWEDFGVPKNAWKKSEENFAQENKKIITKDRMKLQDKIKQRNIENKTNMKDEKFKYYLYDLCVIIKEKAKEAQYNQKHSNELNESSNKTGSFMAGEGERSSHSYNIGYLMAFHEVIDLMKQLATAFNIDQKDIGLTDIDAEKDLL
ncbi:MAG TPA: hypothetical protein VKR53_03180 [Puia sp.]|nr:hypothetical protein [Puia sp.]